MRGNLVYLYAALRALAAWKPARFTVVVDGERHEVTGWSVGVGNSKAYGGGMFVAPHAELDDGQLDVVAKAETSKLRFLRDLPSVFKGKLLELPEHQGVPGRGGQRRGRPAVRRLRRRRPDRHAPPRPCACAGRCCA